MKGNIWADREKEPMKEYKISKPIRLIELFAGVGAQAMALRDLGADYETRRISEWNIFSNRSYKAIHNPGDETDYSEGMDFASVVGALCDLGISSDGKTPLTIEQIRRRGEADCRKIYNEFRANRNIGSIMNRKGEDLGITDTEKNEYIMTYSFPCQDISFAGRQKGMAKGSGTRSGLLWEVERLLGELGEKPQVLVMENVPAIHSKKNMADFQRWIECLEKMGYSNHWHDMNAKDFGVPQNRNRTFMVSILGAYAYSFPEPIGLTRRMRDCLEDGTDKKYYLRSEKVRRLMDKMIADGNLGSLGETRGQPGATEACGTIYHGTSDRFFHGIPEDGNIARTVKAEKHDLCVVEGKRDSIPCLCDKKDGEKFLNMDTFGIRRVNTDVSGTICARYHKGIGGDGDNMVLEAMKVGNIDGHTGGNFGAVYDPEGICPTLVAHTTGGFKEPLMLEKAMAIMGSRHESQQESAQGAMRDARQDGGITGAKILKVGNIDGHTGGNFGAVYDPEGLAPMVSGHSGGLTEPMVLEGKQIVAMRGRNPDNPSDRTVGMPTEQRLEPNSMGICNTLTSVAKDNLVLEAGAMENVVINDRGFANKEPQMSVGVEPTLRAQAHGNLPKIIEASEPREAGDGGVAYETADGAVTFRIRRLTPRECWRLMDFSDEDYDRAASANSESQLYSQAGNSLVRSVMAAIFSQLNLPGVTAWNEWRRGKEPKSANIAMEKADAGQTYGRDREMA